MFVLRRIPQKYRVDIFFFNKIYSIQKKFSTSSNLDKTFLRKNKSKQIILEKFVFLYNHTMIGGGSNCYYLNNSYEISSIEIGGVRSVHFLLL